MCTIRVFRNWNFVEKIAKKKQIIELDYICVVQSLSTYYSRCFVRSHTSLKRTILLYCQSQPASEKRSEIRAMYGMGEQVINEFIKCMIKCKLVCTYNHNHRSLLKVKSSSFLWFAMFFLSLLFSTHFGVDEKIKLVTLDVRTGKAAKGFDCYCFVFLILILLCQEAKCGNSSSAHTHVHIERERETWTICTNLFVFFHIQDVSLWSRKSFIDVRRNIS